MEFMDEQTQDRSSSTAASLWAVLRRPLLAALLAAAALFLAAFYVPAKWMSAISWQLYLDRLSPMFNQPVGWDGRVLLGGIFALAAFAITLFIALLIPSRAAEHAAAADQDRSFSFPDSAISDELMPPIAAHMFEPEREQAEALPARNKLDRHPDDAPRAPISAVRDLPAGGLGPAGDAGVSSPAAISGDPVLVLADLAPEGRTAAGEEPWLQAVEPSGPASPDRSDISLSAMVARLETGFLRRRTVPPAAATIAVPVPDITTPPPRTVADHSVDLALEAALGTLHRMNLRAVG